MSTIHVQYSPPCIDPAAYPWNVYEIYPEVPVQGTRFDGGVVVTLQSSYPAFNICE